MSSAPVDPNESNARLVQIPGIVFCVVTPIFVAIRFWSRIRIQRALGADDWTILVSLIFALLVSILCIKACDYGFGRHIQTLAPSDKKMALKLFYVAQAFYKININLTKASIILLYLRIFIQKTFRIICWVMLSIVVAYMIATTVAAIFQCSPVSRAWDKTVPGTCINITQNWFANAGFSIATDVIILLMPMPIIYSLKLQIGQKLGLMFIFALGGFVVVTSILRMTTLDLSSTSPDTTYQITSSLWTIVEENIGIICACLPMCRVPLQIMFPSIFPQTLANSSKAYPSTGKFTHASTGKSEWSPPSAKVQDVPLSSVHATRNDSEEYILQATDGYSEGEHPETTGIHKVTQFTLDYNDVDKAERGTRKG